MKCIPPPQIYSLFRCALCPPAQVSSFSFWKSETDFLASAFRYVFAGYAQNSFFIYAQTHNTFVAKQIVYFSIQMTRFKTKPEPFGSEQHLQYIACEIPKYSF
jgi:hypothetical protein